MSFYDVDPNWRDPLILAAVLLVGTLAWLGIQRLWFVICCRTDAKVEHAVTEALGAPSRILTLDDVTEDIDWVNEDRLPAADFDAWEREVAS